MFFPAFRRGKGSVVLFFEAAAASAFLAAAGYLDGIQRTIAALRVIAAFLYVAADRIVLFHSIASF